MKRKSLKEANKLGLTATKSIDLVEYLSKNFYYILTGLGGVLLTLSGDFANTHEQCVTFWEQKHYIKSIFSHEWVLLVAGLIAGLSGLIGTSSKNRELEKENMKLKDLESEIKELKEKIDDCQEDSQKLQGKVREKHQEVVKTWLKFFAVQTGLNTHERLTVYYEDEEEFTLLARFSQNKAYDNIHHQKFPLNSGVISEAWKHNEWIEDTSPMYDSQNEYEYLDYMSKKYSFTKERLKKVTMKSDKLFGLAIQETDENIGVLLYEKISIKKDEKEQEDFETKITKLQALYETYKDYSRKFVKDAISLDITKKSSQGKDVEKELLVELKGERS